MLQMLLCLLPSTKRTLKKVFVLSPYSLYSYSNWTFPSGPIASCSISFQFYTTAVDDLDHKRAK